MTFLDFVFKVEENVFQQSRRIAIKRRFDGVRNKGDGDVFDIQNVIFVRDERHFYRPSAFGRFACFRESFYLPSNDFPSKRVLFREISEIGARGTVWDRRRRADIPNFPFFRTRPMR